MDKPVLSRIQRSWLQEIGIDARMLAHFSMEPFAQAPVPSAPAPVAGAGAESPVRDQGRPVSPPAPDKADSPGATIIADLLKRSPVTRDAVGAPQAAASAGQAPAVMAGSLQELRDQAEQCMACALHEVRGRVVFGEGMDTAPSWMFVGEAPGAYDDSAGRPFQGRPGELLQAMLASIGLGEDAPAYFTNVLKCRPMGNRSPKAAEIAACMPLLQRQIQLVKPACLIALGRVSAGALLGSDEDLDTLRGKVHEYVDADGRSIPLVVTHHPAALLLHGQLKAEAWRDLNLLPGLRR